MDEVSDTITPQELDEIRIAIEFVRQSGNYNMIYGEDQRKAHLEVLTILAYFFSVNSYNYVKKNTREYYALVLQGGTPLVREMANSSPYSIDAIRMLQRSPNEDDQEIFNNIRDYWNKIHRDDFENVNSSQWYRFMIDQLQEKSIDTAREYLKLDPGYMRKSGILNIEQKIYMGNELNVGRYLGLNTFKIN